jgi:hypothetical protein
MLSTFDRLRVSAKLRQTLGFNTISVAQRALRPDLVVASGNDQVWDPLKVEPGFMQ